MILDIRALTFYSSLIEQTQPADNMKLVIPARYWDDYSERSPIDSPEQMALEVSRSGSRVTIEASAVQLGYLLGDARFYAEGNTDDTPPAVVRGARRVVELCGSVA
jgi:hypothetical protein